MTRCDLRDVLTGGVLAAFGLFVFFHATSTLDIGTTRQMGPGMSPAGAGGLLAAFGVVIAVRGLLTRAPMPPLDVRTAAIILAAIAAFALLLDWVGLVAAMVGMTVIATLASERSRVRSTLILAACLTGLAILLSLGLGIPMPLFAWPV